MARTTTESTPEPAKRMIVSYPEGKGIPGLQRLITKADAKAAWGVDLENDLFWSADNDHEIDVTDLPAEAIEGLRKERGIGPERRGRLQFKETEAEHFPESTD